MKNRPEKILLDLFCGAGGAGEGYRRAGFKVIGADIEPHDYHPGEFVQADVMAQFHALVLAYDPDVIHASPPCQAFSTATRDHSRHPNHIPALQELLRSTGRPYVIENVPAAPLIDPVKLCGSMFDLGVRRHRVFEIGNATLATEVPRCDHARQGQVLGVYGQHADRRNYLRPDGTRRGTKATSVEEGREVMGIDWPMSWVDLVEAIPPQYTEFIGNHIQKEIHHV